MAKETNNGAARSDSVKSGILTRCPKCGATTFRMVQTGGVVEGRFVVANTDAVCTVCNTVIEANG